MRLWLSIFLAALSALAAFAAPFEATLLSGEAEIRFMGDAATLSLAEPYTATLVVTAPAGVAVDMPGLDAIRARFQGFSLAEGYALAPRNLPDGRVETSSRWRLVADPTATRYRLAPFAVELADGARRQLGSFATAPVLFPLDALPSAEGGVELAARKFFVWPTPRELLRWAVRALALLAVAALVVFLAGRIGRAVRLHRMTPSERALEELATLLNRRLVDRGLFKDYYVELTHVVRRYIERSYAIKAPKLTTEEFLAAASRHPHFTPEALKCLDEFLKSSDLVKFAGVSATPAMADEAAATARRYITRDAATAMPKGGRR